MKCYHECPSYCPNKHQDRSFPPCARNVPRRSGSSAPNHTSYSRLTGAAFCREAGSGHRAGLAHRRSRAITVAGPSYGLPDRLGGRCKHCAATMATEVLRRLKGLGLQVLRTRCSGVIGANRDPISNIYNLDIEPMRFIRDVSTSKSAKTASRAVQPLSRRTLRSRRYPMRFRKDYASASSVDRKAFRFGSRPHSGLRTHVETCSHGP